MTLARLVYYSHHRMAGGEQAWIAGLHTILEQSRRNNPAYDITGALLFNMTHFTQVLEGPSDGVAEIYDRIARDDRHTGVTLLQHQTVDGRVFPDWSMGGMLLGRETRDIIARHGINGSVDPAGLTGDAVVALAADLSTNTVQCI